MPIVLSRIACLPRNLSALFVGAEMDEIPPFSRMQAAFTVLLGKSQSIIQKGFQEYCTQNAVIWKRD
jgi:hypothetical protein